MKGANILRVILSGFIAALIMTIMIYTLIMCAPQTMGTPKKEVTNSPFNAQIGEIWVPDGTLDSIYCRAKDRTMIKEHIDLVDGTKGRK